MAFDEFYGAALGMSAVRRPPRVERATSHIQRIGAGRHEMGSRSNSPRPTDGWELDAGGGCFRRAQSAAVSVAFVDAGRCDIDLLTRRKAARAPSKKRSLFVWWTASQ